MVSVEEKQKTVFLIGAGAESKEKLQNSLLELERLADTAGYITIGSAIQSFKEQTKATFIGSGKVEEIKEQILQLKPDLVVVNEMIKNFQIRNLSEAFGVDVMDRYMLILEIFSQRAKTAEGKVQVEIAQMKYNMSRLNIIKENDERYRGGYGSRGPGESKLELERRAIRAKLKSLQDKIDELKRQRDLARNKRMEHREKLVAIVGYTNAGKSTLLNALAKDDIYADDKLFATLDTTTRKIFLDYKHHFLITDTVGFISKLPHELVEAFQSTLEEARYADCIVHVVDASDKNCLEQIEVTKSVLAKIGADGIPTILALNKVDKCEDMSIFKDFDYISISAKNNQNLDELKKMISKIVFPDFDYVPAN